MGDDERADGRDPDVAARLAVEPLDDVTRRRLVSTALRHADAPGTHARSSRVWRWIAAAAALVVIVAGTLAIVTAGGGNDEHRATGPTHAPTAAGAAPPSLATVPDVGDFGDLDQPGNLARLRRALQANDRFAQGEASASAPSADATGRAVAGALPACATVVPSDATAIAQATGTIDGRRTTVLLVERADGTRHVDAVLVDPCELRELS